MLSILTLNIGAAAHTRAQALLRWLAERGEDVLILTETSNGPGTAHILQHYARAGYAVCHTPDPGGQRGVALLSRVPFAVSPDHWFAQVSIPTRIAAAVLATDPPLTVVGIYVPSRDRSAAKTQRKRRFIDSFLRAVDQLPAEHRQRMLLGGDYNVISRTHQPLHRGFLPFEFDLLEALHAGGFLDAHQHHAPGDQPHSWIGRTGDGYRYDYFHLAAGLADRIALSRYLHDPRDQRLTDHAALTLTLTLDIAVPPSGPSPTGQHITFLPKVQGQEAELQPADHDPEMPGQPDRARHPRAT